MKKTILTLSMLFLLLSCNKDDDNNNGNLVIDYNTIQGTYKIKEVIKGDGSIVPYTSNCPSEDDTVVIEFKKIYVYIHRTDCTVDNSNSCLSLTLSNGKTYGCNGIMDGTITELTNEKLTLMNDEAINSGNQFNGNKGIVLYR